MKKPFTLIILFSVFFLSACYISLPESSNPEIQLEQANNHLAQGEVFAAERLYMEAIQNYEKTNRTVELGNAYHDFGRFLRSPEIAQKEQTYRQAGFLDQSITLDNRFAKSDEYLDKALTQYKQAETLYQKQERFDLLSTLYYTQAGVYLLQDKNTMACSIYDQSRNAYAENAVRNPSIKPPIPEGYTSFHDAVTAAKSKAGCDNP